MLSPNATSRVTPTARGGLMAVDGELVLVSATAGAPGVVLVGGSSTTAEGAVGVWEQPAAKSATVRKGHRNRPKDIWLSYPAQQKVTVRFSPQPLRFVSMF